jgi:hypothetical protein
MRNSPKNVSAEEAKPQGTEAAVMRAAAIKPAIHRLVRFMRELLSGQMGDQN